MEGYDVRIYFTLAGDGYMEDNIDKNTINDETFDLDDIDVYIEEELLNLQN